MTASSNRKPETVQPSPDFFGAGPRVVAPGVNMRSRPAPASACINATTVAILAPSSMARLCHLPRGPGDKINFELAPAISRTIHSATRCANLAHYLFVCHIFRAGTGTPPAHSRIAVGYRLHSRTASHHVLATVASAKRTSHGKHCWLSGCEPHDVRRTELGGAPIAATPSSRWSAFAAGLAGRNLRRHRYYYLDRYIANTFLNICR